MKHTPIRQENTPEYVDLSGNCAACGKKDGGEIDLAATFEIDLVSYTAVCPECFEEIAAEREKSNRLREKAAGEEVEEEWEGEKL